MRIGICNCSDVVVERVAAIQEAGILHDDRGLLAGEISAGTDADAFFFTAKRHMFEFSVFLHRTNHFEHFFIRQSRDKIDACFLSARRRSAPPPKLGLH
jgi:hypothetical protein